MNRRSFIGLVGASAMGACTVGDEYPAGTSGVVERAWETRATSLEGTGALHTAATPGMWAGKEATHIPAVTFNADGTITVATTHGVAMDHWVTTIFVRDQDRVVIHLVEFVARGTGVLPSASTTFRPRSGTTSITAYAYCNQHDLWADVERALS